MKPLAGQGPCTRVCSSQPRPQGPCTRMCSSQPHPQGSPFKPQPPRGREHRGPEGGGLRTCSFWPLEAPGWTPCGLCPQTCSLLRSPGDPMKLGRVEQLSALIIPRRKMLCAHPTQPGTCALLRRAETVQRATVLTQDRAQGQQGPGLGMQAGDQPRVYTPQLSSPSLRQAPKSVTLLSKYRDPSPGPEEQRSAGVPGWPGQQAPP